MRKAIHSSPSSCWTAISVTPTRPTGGDDHDIRTQPGRPDGELPDRSIVGVRSWLETLSGQALRLVQVASLFGHPFSAHVHFQTAMLGDA